MEEHFYLGQVVWAWDNDPKEAKEGIFVSYCVVNAYLVVHSTTQYDNDWYKNISATKPVVAVPLDQSVFDDVNEKYKIAIVTWDGYVRFGTFEDAKLPGHGPRIWKGVGEGEWITSKIHTTYEYEKLTKIIREKKRVPLDQRVFDGLEEKWKVAVVSEDGHVCFGTFEDAKLVKRGRELWKGIGEGKWSNSLIPTGKYELKTKLIRESTIAPSIEGYEFSMIKPNNIGLLSFFDDYGNNRLLSECYDLNYVAGFWFKITPDVLYSYPIGYTKDGENFIFSSMVKGQSQVHADYVAFKKEAVK